MSRVTPIKNSKYKFNIKVKSQVVQSIDHTIEVDLYCYEKFTDPATKHLNELKFNSEPATANGRVAVLQPNKREFNPNSSTYRNSSSTEARQTNG